MFTVSKGKKKLAGLANIRHFSYQDQKEKFTEIKEKFWTQAVAVLSVNETIAISMSGRGHALMLRDIILCETSIHAALDTLSDYYDFEKKTFIAGKTLDKNIFIEQLDILNESLAKLHIHFSQWQEKGEDYTDALARDNDDGTGGTLGEALHDWLKDGDHKDGGFPQDLSGFRQQINTGRDAQILLFHADQQIACLHLDQTAAIVFDRSVLAKAKGDKPGYSIS